MMNDFEADLEALKKLKEKKARAAKNYSDFLKSMVFHSPVKIGYELKCNGYSHKGKSIVIDHIRLVEYWLDDYKFKASGYIKKKDGTLGKQRGDWLERN